MIHIPYQLIEKLFGEWVAQNFNTISACLVTIGFCLYIIRPGRLKIRITISRKKAEKNRNSDDWLIRAQQRQEDRFDYLSPQKQSNNNTKNKKDTWYPTGWTFNEKTQLWEPPDYKK